MKYIYQITAILVVAFLLVQCSDEIVSHEHVDAVGLRVVSSGVTLTSYVQDDTSSFSAIQLEYGVMSGHMDIELYDEEDDEWFTPTGSEYALEIDIADTSVCEYWQHEGEEGGFEFHLTGKKVANTTTTFRVLHDGHTDFESRPVKIEVVAAN